MTARSVDERIRDMVRSVVDHASPPVPFEALSREHVIGPVTAPARARSARRYLLVTFTSVIGIAAVSAAIFYGSAWTSPGSPVVPSETSIGSDSVASAPDGTVAESSSTPQGTERVVSSGNNCGSAHQAEVVDYLKDRVHTFTVSTLTGSCEVEVIATGLSPETIKWLTSRSFHIRIVDRSVEPG